MILFCIKWWDLPAFWWAVWRAQEPIICHFHSRTLRTLQIWKLNRCLPPMFISQMGTKSNFLQYLNGGGEARHPWDTLQAHVERSSNSLHPTIQFLSSTIFHHEFPYSILLCIIGGSRKQRRQRWIQSTWLAYRVHASAAFPLHVHSCPFIASPLSSSIAIWRTRWILQTT